MAETITLTLNMGPNASVHAVSSAVEDLSRVLAFASDLQRRTDRSALLSTRVRARRPRATDMGFLMWGDFVPIYAEGYAGPPDEFERIAAREVDENARVTVKSLSYQNPLILEIAAAGVVILAVLRMLRNWPDRKRLNDAAATEYENKVIFRERVRERVLTQIDNGDLPLTPEVIETLLTDDVADSLGALGDGPLTITGLPKSDKSGAGATD